MSTKNLSLRAVAGAACWVALAAALPAQATTQAVLRGVVAGVPSSPTFGNGHASSLVLPDVLVNLAGISSYDGQGEPINTVLTIDATPGATVDAISWNLTLSTFGASWLSEATLLILNADGDGVVFSPGFGDDFSGVGSYAGSASLVALNLSFSVLADGKLSFELFEGFDDLPGEADALYTAGNLTLGAIGVSVVPEPGVYGMLALGLLAVAAAARRRKTD